VCVVHCMPVAFRLLDRNRNHNYYGKTLALTLKDGDGTSDSCFRDDVT